MNLKQRLSKEVGIVGIVFAVLFMIITAIFLQFSTSVNNIMTQSEPVLEALNDMQVDVYQKHIVLTEYLQTTTYAESLSVSQKLNQQFTSESFSESLRQAVRAELITDESIIQEYENAIALYDQLETFRIQLLDIHEREITSNIYASSQKRELLADYSVFLASASEEFDSKIRALETQNQDAKDDLIVQSRFYAILLAILLIIFISTIVYTVRKFSNQIITPLDDTIESTKLFVEGDYGHKIRKKSKITEIADLQDNINSVFSAINEVVKKDVNKGKEIRKNLLKKEYVEILNYLSDMQNQQRKVTISDVKKQFHITHPTALSRITFLREKEYIDIQKEGRDKCLILL